MYLCLVNGILAGFYSVLTFPHPKVKRCKRGHRLIILPDYQGIGIASCFSEAIAEMYKQQGYTFIATTSNPALINKRCKSPKWIATTKKNRKIPGNKNRYSISTPKNTSNARLTVNFKYVGSK